MIIGKNNFHSRLDSQSGCVRDFQVVVYDVRTAVEIPKRVRLQPEI